jgi:hypothetical protein
MKIKVDGLEETLDALGNLKMPSLAKAQVQRRAAWWDTQLEKYPKKQAGAFSRLATPAQKRAFWAKVSRGEARIDGQGYVRSFKLAKGWRYRTIESGRRLVRFYNDIPYSNFIYDAPVQQPFHKASGFFTTEDKEREIAADFQSLLSDYVKGIKI